MPHHRDRRILEEIERELRAADPRFAQKMTHVQPHMKAWAWLTFPRAVGVLAAVLALLCLIFQEGYGFITSALLVGFLLVFRGWTVRSR